MDAHKQRNEKRANPFLFVVGCARSGTTLLRRMVGAHSQIAFPRETHWIPKLYEERVGVNDDGSVTPRLLSELLHNPRFVRMGIDGGAVQRLLQAANSISYSDFVSGIFDLYGDSQGKPLVGDKTPGYVRSIHTLHMLWPEAKFVHLIRDGRDVALSLLEWERAPRNVGHFATWQEDRLVTAALWWEWQVRLGREAGARLGPDLYHEIRYEELVRSPEDTCLSLCRFLEVEYEGAMARGSADRGASLSSLPPRAGIRSWRTQMSGPDLERFDATAGPLLDELGYERIPGTPSAAATEHACKLRANFSRDALERNRKLPQRWPG
jgi:hypothetical protein